MSLPFHLLKFTPRYKQAEAALARAPFVTRVAGHSLGGSIALNLAHAHNLEYETYAAPALSWTPDEHQHAHYGDPIAAFNRGATRTPAWYPHGY